MDNNEQLEALAKLLKEQNQLISRLGLITTRIAGMLLFILVIQLVLVVIAVFF